MAIFSEDNINIAGSIASIVSLLIVLIPLMGAIAGWWRRFAFGALLITAIGFNVAMLLIQLGGAPSARTPQTTEPPTAAAANPIHDKVNRYNVIEGINASIKSGDVPRDCRVVLVHYSQPYSETYAKEMKTLLELGLRWQVTDLLATTSLPQGISLRAIDKSQGKKCAEAMEIRLRNLTWRGGNLQAFADFVPVDNAPEYLRNCEQPCMEMDVGNEQ